MPVYVAEQHVQEWTSAAILRYLGTRRYAVRDWHVTQDLERQVPTDWVFVDTSRMKFFGFQYKALYSNGSDHWRLDSVQHTTLQGFPWAYYAASEIKRARQRVEALRLIRIYAPEIPYRSRLAVVGASQDIFAGPASSALLLHVWWDTALAQYRTSYLFWGKSLVRGRFARRAR